jgi:uracil-DNA glycosylase family 4
MPNQIKLFDSKAIGSINTYENPTFYSSLEHLSKDCQNCKRCELSQSRNCTVVGRGNPNAKLLIIGEAPGVEEDKRGLPFVGKSGQLLEKILASVNLKVEKDTYITNAICCRPPDNRTPVASEIKACRPYLIEQIYLIKPQIILLVGAIAYFSLIGKKQQISKIRGKWIEWQGIDCMPIFHPAYLLRNPTLEKGSPKWMTWQDLIKVRSRFLKFNFKVKKSYFVDLQS